MHTGRAILAHRARIYVQLGSWWKFRKSDIYLLIHTFTGIYPEGTETGH